MVTTNIPSKARMLGSIASWTAKLRDSTDRQNEGADEAAQEALSKVEDAVANLDSGDTVHSKKEIRDQLWEFRMAFPADADPEIKRSYEKLRNLTLDNTVERMAKGAKIPMSHFTTYPPASDIPNFQVLNDKYLRGGQPDQDGINWLSSAKIKSVVDLRGDDRENQWHPPAWNPMRTFQVDVPDFASPTVEMAEKFIDIVDNPANQPVFVHCKAGVGRTGVMTACWNIAHGMTAEEALRQESINSYHGTLRQEDFVREFEAHWRDKHAPLATVA